MLIIGEVDSFLEKSWAMFFSAGWLILGSGEGWARVQLVHEVVIKVSLILISLSLFVYHFPTLRVHVWFHTTLLHTLVHLTLLLFFPFRLFHIYINKLHSRPISCYFYLVSVWMNSWVSLLFSLFSSYHVVYFWH